MKIKNLIKDNKLIVSLRLFLELLHDYRRLVSHLGAINVQTDKDKFFANILISVHSIEKGLSLPHPRPGFGKLKILNTLQQMDVYKRRYGYDSLFEIAKPVFDAYIYFCKDTADKEILKKYTDTFLDFPSKLELSGGVQKVYKHDIWASSLIDFESFCNTRYSIRDFSDQPVDIELINKAAKISTKAPSACNRQPWHIYTFRDIEKKNELLEWQLGNKGFGTAIDTVLLLTCNLKSYFINESHQAYVDGGLYAMTLMYALHSLGLGTIPLTVAMMNSRNQILYDKFGIKDYEVPIVLIGVGHLKDSFNVAISERFNYDDYMTVI